MRKSLLTLSTVCLLVIASCKKDSKQEEEQAKTCQLTESTFTATGGDSDKSLLIYDDKGRIKTATYSEGSLDSYVYSDTQIILTASGNVITTYKLDANGRITSESYNDDPSKINYTYNAEGFLAEENEVVGQNTYKTKYTYTNGNLTLIEYDNTKIAVSYTNEIVPANYYNAVDNDLPSSISGALKGYFGKASKNLVLKTTYTDGSSDAYSETYSYEKDSDSNITKVSVTASDSKGYIVSNKYNCK